MPLMRDTPIKTAAALGLQLRARRLASGLSQAALAERIGVERKWIIRLEAGNSVAELGAVLRAIEALNCDLLLRSHTGESLVRRSGASALDEVLDGLKRPRRS